MIHIFDPRTGELMDTDSVPGLASVAALLDEQLRDLAGRVAELSDPDSPSAVKSQWTWRAQGPHGAQQLWEELADWVGWLRGGIRSPGRCPRAGGAIPSSSRSSPRSGSPGARRTRTRRRR